jgi:hypothetical protein
MLRRLFGTPPPTPVTNELTQHNQAVLRESDVSHVTLPPMFVLWRHPNHERFMRVNGHTHEQAYSAACIVTERINGAIHPLWKLTLVEQPLEALGRCMVTLWPDNWLSGQKHKIIIRRPSPHQEEHNKLYVTEIQHTRYALRLENNQAVPILKLENPCLVLHTRFSQLDTTHMESFGFVCDHGRELIPPTLIRRDELRRQAIQMAQRAAQTLLERSQEAPVPPTPQPVVQRRVSPPPVPPTPVAQPSTRATMPQHIVNTVIETLVTQEKECPILQTPLEKETTCLTPCGHAMTTDAAARWIQGARSCPECRSPCLVDQLQVWRA